MTGIVLSDNAPSWRECYESGSVFATIVYQTGLAFGMLLLGRRGTDKETWGMCICLYKSQPNEGESVNDGR